MKPTERSKFATIRHKMWVAMVSSREREVKRVLRERGLDK
jgi:hypothetical protein